MKTSTAKSLAHPDWPYAGTAHEWRGFVKDEARKEALERLEGHESPLAGLDEVLLRALKDFVGDEGCGTIYQKQSFGPDLP